MTDGKRVVPGLYYTKDHEWARVEGDVVIVGITDYAQNALHEITFVEVSEVGTELKAGAPCGLVESMKASSDVFSPISGTVIEVNKNLEKSPEIVNEDPYGAGWLFKMKPSSLDPDLKKLMNDTEYADYIKSL
ncbi:MAG: glycine cleavage system protein GcvH [Candidatus Thorarchaeota archaeon]